MTRMLCAPDVLPLALACVAGGMEEAGLWAVLPAVVVFSACGFGAILSTYAS